MEIFFSVDKSECNDYKKNEFMHLKNIKQIVLLAMKVN